MYINFDIISLSLSLCIYIYIYIQRERERERDRQRDTESEREMWAAGGGRGRRRLAHAGAAAEARLAPSLVSISSAYCCLVRRVFFQPFFVSASDFFSSEAPTPNLPAKIRRLETSAKCVGSRSMFREPDF